MRPKPVKKALDLLERFEPSMIKMLVTGKLTEPAYFRMADFSSPGSIGVNLLNNGMIQVGAINWIAREITIMATQQ